MSNVNSYSFGSYSRESSDCQRDLEVLYSLLCKVCCVGFNDYDLDQDLKNYFVEYPEGRDILRNLRDLLSISLH